MVAPRKGESRAGIVARILRRRLRRIGPVFVTVFFLVAVAVYFVERNEPGTKVTSLSDALWFCLVTMSTVGYGDLFPVSPGGRALAAGFILFTLGTVGLLVTAVSEAIMEVQRLESRGLIGTRMTGHVVLCGFNPMARASLEELLSAGREVALLCESAEDQALARTAYPPSKVFVAGGEPSQETLRDRLNGAEAEAFIVAMLDDTKNLIAALNIKVINPAARLVVALQREELRQTLQAGGVTYIASPNELSGRLVASAAFEPAVAHLLEDLLSNAVGTADILQYEAGELGGSSVGEIRELLSELDGPLLVAIGKKNGDGFHVQSNPRRKTRVEASDHLIMISDEGQAARFEAKYGR